jgi:hypothetical protein
VPWGSGLVQTWDGEVRVRLGGVVAWSGGRRWRARYGMSRGTFSCMSRLERITTDPAICHGQPTVRGLRYPVENLLKLLASGMSIEEIIEDHSRSRT